MATVTASLAGERSGYGLGSRTGALKMNQTRVLRGKWIRSSPCSGSSRTDSYRYVAGLAFFCSGGSQGL
jgi:hypothetical protein